MSAHTPGPWEVGNFARELKLQGGFFPIRRSLQGHWGRDSSSLAYVPLDFPSEANARLIAAAPDLLAALEDMAQRYGWHGASVGAHPTVKRALAAIRKAKDGVRL